MHQTKLVEHRPLPATAATCLSSNKAESRRTPKLWSWSFQGNSIPLRLRSLHLPEPTQVIQRASLSCQGWASTDSPSSNPSPSAGHGPSSFTACLGLDDGCVSSTYWWQWNLNPVSHRCWRAQGRVSDPYGSPSFRVLEPQLRKSQRKNIIIALLNMSKVCQVQHSVSINCEENIPRN